MPTPEAIASWVIMSPDAVRAELEAAMRRGYVAAFRWLGSADESRDACQEAAARALAAGERYDTRRPFYPWFYTILKNLCRDRIAERRRITPDSSPGANAESPSAEGQALAQERAMAVGRAIAALPTEHRDVIELRHFQDASYEEIADVLGCPVGTVMSRLYRARQALRAKLLCDPGFVRDRRQGGAGR